MAAHTRSAERMAEQEVLAGSAERRAGKEAFFGLLEKGRPRTHYAIEVDVEKCIGCQMCMLDCAAHHASPKDLPVVYPKSWELVGKAGLFEGALTAEKCDGCVERYEAGLEPVCVQICPSGALSIKPVPQPVDRKGLTLLK